MNQNELYHYGVLGMKWGVRKATYNVRSANGLRKSANGIKKDINKLEVKANRQKRRAAKAQANAGQYMSEGNFSAAGKFMKKAATKNQNAQKREKTILHNKKLLEQYGKRISKLDAKSISKGKDYVSKKVGDNK